MTSIGNDNRLKVFTWHVHGGYLYYLTQANCDFYLPVSASRMDGYGGKVSDDPLGDNVHEIPVDEIKNTSFDVILFQSRQHYEVDQYQIFSPEQLKLPKLYLSHEAPNGHPTNTQHFVTDPSVTLVHVTHYNQLMWYSPNNPTALIEHGVIDPSVQYRGRFERGLVVINNLHKRGRQLGFDIFEDMRKRVPLDIVGLNTQEIGGLGPIRHDELPEFMAQYRFLFSPIRYSSLALSIIEAMMVGLPIVGLATTELSTVITPGVNGYVSLNLDELEGHMRDLLDSPYQAQKLGENAKAYAQKRFSIQRFAADWQKVLTRACASQTYA
jgi:hypothetical protein